MEQAAPWGCLSQPGWRAALQRRIWDRAPAQSASGEHDMAANKQHAKEKCHQLFAHSPSDTVAYTKADQ